jgi:hypothetical protein
MGLLAQLVSWQICVKGILKAVGLILEIFIFQMPDDRQSAVFRGLSLNPGKIFLSSVQIWESF